MMTGDTQYNFSWWEEGSVKYYIIDFWRFYQFSKFHVQLLFLPDQCDGLNVTLDYSPPNLIYKFICTIRVAVLLD